MNLYCGKVGSAPPLGLGDRDKLVKLCGLLGSNHDGERAAAALKADAHIKGLGLTWCDVIIAPAATVDWPAMARAILRSCHATGWEARFCENLLDKWRDREISERQRAVLERVFARCCGG